MMQYLYLSSTQFYATNWNYLPHTAVCPLAQTTITPLTEFDPLHCVAEGLQRWKVEYEWGRGCYETFYEQAGKKKMIINMAMAAISLGFVVLSHTHLYVF